MPHPSRRGACRPCEVAFSIQANAAQCLSATSRTAMARESSARRAVSGPDRGHRGPRRARLDADRQPVAGDRLARRHRRPQPGRRHLRPPAPRRAPHRAQGPLDAADARRASQRPEGDDMSIPSATPAPATLGPGVAERIGGFARGERQRPSGRGPRARERRLQARLAHQPLPTGPTVAACARRAFRGTRVVARRNALADSSSTTVTGHPIIPTCVVNENSSPR